jgi:protein-disulfide isomerase-like protein with CxxC motif
LADARHQLGDDVEWTLRMGGLVVGDRVRAVAHDAEYLRSGLAQVHAASGRSAGDPYWTEIVDVGTWVSDSEPVCRAVLTAIELADTDAGFAASHRLSDLLYVEGVEPDSLDALHEVARTIGLDGDGFVEHWASPHTRDRLTAHWADTRRSGLQTYPTIAVLSDGRLQPVVTGFPRQNIQPCCCFSSQQACQ